MNNKLLVAIVIIIIVIVGAGIYAYNNYNDQNKKIISIYAADSLAQQLNTTAKQFESQHPNVDVQIHYGGSSAIINQVTNLNKSADIVVSADYGLIDQI